VFARKLISTGHPARAIQRLRESLEHKALTGDMELRYLLALAFVRGGNQKEADRFLPELEQAEIPDTRLYIDVHCLRGRTFKDEYRRLSRSGKTDDETRGQMKVNATVSMQAYGKAYERVKEGGEADDIHFPLINLATMTL